MSRTTEPARLTALRSLLSLLGKAVSPLWSAHPNSFDGRDLTATINALYDASASEDRAQAEQWERFVQSMGTFDDVLGPGRFIIALPRGESVPRLMYESDRERVRYPARTLSSGVRQLIALLGQLLTSGASIVLMEEPELHLRHTLQLRLREALCGLVGTTGAPQQLILTSHSGAFETEDFLLMTRTDAGPKVERRPAAEALHVVVGGELRRAHRFD